MLEYKSREAVADGSVEVIYDLLSKPSNLRKLIDNVDDSRIPADKLEMMKKVEVTDDSITLPAGPVGAVTMCLDRCERPSFISMKFANIPMAVGMELHLAPLTEETTQVQCTIKADIPKMMAPMVKGVLQQVPDKVVELLTSFPFRKRED